MTADFSIGLVEVSGLGDAIIMLDDMCKAADVEFVATERRLGGRLVTIVVKGEVSAVKAAVDAGVQRAKSCGTYKASRVIPRPHMEVLPYLHLDEEKDIEPKSESAGTHVGPVTEDNEKPAAARRGRPRKKTAEEAK
ncbi:MAG: BMC domain-containing protein [Candidatus Ornithomonoglobus sp.]